MSIRSLLVAVTLFGVGSSARAQDHKVEEKDVPKAVLDHVHSKYKTSKLTGFEQKVRDGKTLIEVKIEGGEKPLEINCALDGTIVYETEKVTLESVPEKVRAAYKANSKYAPWTFHHAERVVLGEKADNVHYKIKLTQGGIMAKLEFTPDGTLVKTEEKARGGGAPKAAK